MLIAPMKKLDERDERASLKDIPSLNNKRKSRHRVEYLTTIGENYFQIALKSLPEKKNIEKF